MKQTLQPTEINLNELPEEGRTYKYSKDSAELAGKLTDLIKTNNYSIEITILPLGDCFKVNGVIDTVYDLACPRCAIDFQKPEKITFDELLMVDSSTDYSNGSQSRNNLISANNGSDTYCHYIESSLFDVGEFVHEIIAINEPTDATAKPGCDDSCENLQEAIKNGWLKTSGASEAAESAVNTHKPFDLLKEFKLNS